MTRDDEQIKQALRRRLNGVRASPALWDRIERDVATPRCPRRIEATAITMLVMAVGALVFFRLSANEPGKVFLAPSPEHSLTHPLSPSPESSPTPSPPTTSPTPGSNGVKHFVTQGGDLEFSYPQSWVQVSGTGDNGVFVNPQYLPYSDGEPRPGAMKLDFSIGENDQNMSLDDLSARDCEPDPSTERVWECDQRQINGRSWTWTAEQANEDFDGSYAITIRTVASGRIYTLVGIILHGDDVTDQRLGVIRDILESARVNES